MRRRTELIFQVAMVTGIRAVEQVGVELMRAAGAKRREARGLSTIKTPGLLPDRAPSGCRRLIGAGSSQRDGGRVSGEPPPRPRLKWENQIPISRAPRERTVN